MTGLVGPRSMPFMRAILAAIVLGIVVSMLGQMQLRGFETTCKLAAVFLFLAFLASSVTGRLRDGLVVVASLTFGLSLLAGLAVLWGKPTSPTITKGFFAYKAGIGWGAAGAGIFPARKTDPRSGTVIYDVAYTIDESLLRRTVSSESGPTIAFFGDSFTFGEGVDDDETMPQSFADLTERRFHVLNLGFPGYGPNQALYAIESGAFDTLLGSDIRLFVLMTAPWHAERTACKAPFALRGPAYRLQNGRVIYDGACSEGPSLLLREWIQNTALYRLVLEPYIQRVAHDDITLYIEIVVATVDLAKKKYGVTMLIPYLPVGDEYLRHTGFTDEAIVKRFEEAGAVVVDVSLAKERIAGAVIDIAGDGHPTALAHLARARTIRACIAKEMPGVLAQ